MILHEPKFTSLGWVMIWLLVMFLQLMGLR